MIHGSHLLFIGLFGVPLLIGFLFWIVDLLTTPPSMRWAPDADTSYQKNASWDSQHPYSNKQCVFHGTRIPIEEVTNIGVHPLSSATRTKLVSNLLLFLEQYGIRSTDTNINITAYGEKVFASEDFPTAQKYALVAPAFASDILYSLLTKMGMPKEKQDIVVMGTLSRLIGEPKVIECEIDASRINGYQLDCINPEDIKKVHLIKFGGEKEDVRANQSAAFQYSQN